LPLYNDCILCEGLLSCDQFDEDVDVPDLRVDL
jgi:hypothetical protein